MIANPQATTHEPTRCPVKFNRPKYAGRVCLIEVTRFPAEARRSSGIPGTPSFRRSLIAHSGRMGARRGFLRGRRRSFPLLFQNEAPPDGRIASRQASGSPSWPRRKPRRALIRWDLRDRIARRGQREDRGEHPPERDSIVPYSPASNFAMASRNASP